MKLDIRVHDILEHEEAVVLRIQYAPYSDKCSHTVKQSVALEN